MSQFDKIAKRNNDKMLTAVRQTVRKMGLKIINMSPVDTGRFKESWRASINQPDLSLNESGAGLRPTVMSLKLGDTFYFTNNQPYALRLEFGWSQQAPRGMVRLTIADFQGELNRQIKFIKNPVL